MSNTKPNGATSILRMLFAQSKYIKLTLSILQMHFYLIFRYIRHCNVGEHTKVFVVQIQTSALSFNLCCYYIYKTEVGEKSERNMGGGYYALPQKLRKSVSLYSIHTCPSHSVSCGVLC